MATRSRAAEIVGERIRARRRALGLTIAQITLHAGLDQGTYTRIERGGTNITLHTIVKIAHALELDSGELIAGIEVTDLPGADQFGAAMKAADPR